MRKTKSPVAMRSELEIIDHLSNTIVELKQQILTANNRKQDARFASRPLKPTAGMPHHHMKLRKVKGEIQWFDIWHNRWRRDWPDFFIKRMLRRNYELTKESQK